MRIRPMKHVTSRFFALSALAFSLSLTGCSNASSAEAASNAPQVEGVSSPAKAVSQNNWDIIAEGSHIRFTAQQEGQDFTGEFTEFSGHIDFDPEAPEAGSVEINIPLASVEAGSRDRNSTLPSKVWFSAKSFPVATFTSTDFSQTSDGYLARGELALKGKSVPVELPFSLSIDGDRAVMTGEIAIDRTRWNVGADPWNTDEWVSRTVTLDIQVTADLKPN